MVNVLGGQWQENYDNKEGVEIMKIMEMFSRRRGFTDNNQGIVLMTVIFAAILIFGGIALLWFLSQIIVPLIILLVTVIIFSFVLKRIWGIRAPEALGRGAGKAIRYGERGVKAGASWFETLIGKGR